MRRTDPIAPADLARGLLPGNPRHAGGDGLPPGAPTTDPPAPARHDHAGWRWTRRILTAAFFALLAALLWRQARGIAWGDVREALGQVRAGTLAAATALAAASYAVYSGYDLLSRHYSGHELPARRVLGVTFVCYAFNLNLGSLVGGFALRYRLYSRLGLDGPTIARIVSFSLATNWLGYLALAGGLFLLQPPEPPPEWRLDTGGLRVLGGAMLAAALAYLAACAFARRRCWSLRGHEFCLPPPRLALAQLGLSTLNWLLIGTIVYLLLQQRLPYAAVLSTMLVAAVAGVVTHVPAGLGVLEAVVVALLSHRAPAAQLLAALLAYRAIYYLAPLALAAVAYVRAELHWRRSHPEERRARASRAARARALAREPADAGRRSSPGARERRAWGRPDDARWGDIDPALRPASGTESTPRRREEPAPWSRG